MVLFSASRGNTFVGGTCALASALLVTSADVFWLSLFVCVRVSMDYYESYQPISLKLDVMTGPTDRKNRLTFDDDPVPDTDYGSLFCSSLTIAEHGILGDLLQNSAN